MAPPYNPLAEMIREIISLPFVLIRDSYRGWQRWRAVPLESKSHIRASVGAMVLVVLIGASIAHLIPYDRSAETWGAIGIAGVALLYLVVGLLGARCRRDPMSVIWWGVGTASCVGLLVYAREAGW